MRFLTAALLLLVAWPLFALEVGGPVHKGVEVTCDYPQAKFVHNTGGRDGVGLCVFTSIQFAAEWADVGQLKDFQKYMKQFPGGGYPQKVDAMIKRKCGANAPQYMQYEGTDPSIVQKAVQSGRLCCVTYDGRDPHYRGHVEHMVCVCHYDDQWVVILDNNFGTDELVWCTHAEFKSRWIGGQGRQGWAVILLEPGCPPTPPRT